MLIQLTGASGAPYEYLGILTHNIFYVNMSIFIILKTKYGCPQKSFVCFIYAYVITSS